MNEVYAFLKGNPIFYVATVSDGKPKNRPFGSVAEFEGKLYIATSNQKEVYRQFQSNPNVEIVGMDRGGTWVRITAQVQEDNRRDARVKMLQENPPLVQMYHADDEKLSVFTVHNATATFYYPNGATKAVAF